MRSDGHVFPDRRLTTELAAGAFDCKRHRGNDADEKMWAGSGLAIADQADLFTSCVVVEGQALAYIRIAEADIHGDDVVA